MAGEGLIDAVVNQLVGEVVQALAGGVADVHAGPGADVGGIALDLHVLAFVFVGANEVGVGSIVTRGGLVTHMSILCGGQLFRKFCASANSKRAITRHRLGSEGRRWCGSARPRAAWRAACACETTPAP